MTETDVVALVFYYVELVGSAQTLAQQWGVSVNDINEVIECRQTPQPVILERLGLEKRVQTTYHVKPGKRQATLVTVVPD